MTQRKVRVRFAPSPTGALHIGGVRTALYWLRDLTRGNEEQVFTYYDNKQIFTEGYWNLLF